MTSLGENHANYKQMSLLSPGKVTEVHLREDHELVQITDLLDWDELILLAMNCRSAKVKKETGPQPRYRELLGAVVLMSVKGFDCRQAEDMIAHYASARYLCDLMSSTFLAACSSFKPLLCSSSTMSKC
jgi:hypothetical protein